MRARDWKPAGQGYPLGRWRLDIDSKGDVDVFLPRTDKVDFSTEFAVDGSRVAIEDIPVCPGQRSRYTWRANSHTLTLSVVDDGGCAPAAALFGGAWQRRG
jgi:hypothetical protein